MSGLWRERLRGGAATRKKPIPGRANEDAALCRVVDGVVGVFDGIGMYAEARLASQIARQHCTPLLRGIDRQQFTTPDEALGAVGKALLAAQDGVMELQRQFPEAGDGGTTATIAKLWQPTPDAPLTALYVNIGDSRLYHWNAKEKRLTRLTDDDNILRNWRELGWIDGGIVDAITTLLDNFTGDVVLPPAAREAWDNRNTICAWLGMPDITYSGGVIELAPGDRLVATTDGIHDNLTWDEMERIISRPKADPRELALNLVDVAEAIAHEDESPRAKPDDMTAAVLIIDR
ncbi:MAG: SpoIIE family protein phosphatase [Ktedonobacterales bacterium]|nr:SpoIIE family protein phosphatase [Ktedonobacterales bacterium]